MKIVILGLSILPLGETDTRRLIEGWCVNWQRDRTISYSLSVMSLVRGKS